jgi:hypothetical protein
MATYYYAFYRQWVSVPFSLAYLADASEADKIDIETLLESLEKKVDRNSTTPNCITSKV